MAEPDWSRYPALDAARRFSLDIERRARARLASFDGAAADVATVTFCGSLGRLEAGPESDVDCIVVSERGTTQGAGLPADAFASLGLRPSKPWGIYRTPIAVPALLDAAALGSLEEAPATFGKRMQLLLDARPVYGEARFASLQRELVDWYGSGFLDREPRRGWTFLVNDLMRYLHAYAAWQQYRFDRDGDDSWFLRQAKFRSTRIPTIAALLLLLGQSNARPDKRAWLCERLHLTPLERLHAVMSRYDEASFGRFVTAYERCHAALADPACRAALIAAGPEEPPGADPEADDVFGTIRRESRAVIRILTAFLLDRREDWDPRFFERVIF